VYALCGHPEVEVEAAGIKQRNISAHCTRRSDVIQPLSEHLTSAFAGDPASHSFLTHFALKMMSGGPYSPRALKDASMVVVSPLSPGVIR